MDVDLHGLFKENASFEYDDYEIGGVCVPVRDGLFIPALYSLALVLGLAGNGVVLLVLYQKRQKWSVTDVFVLHLAVADVLLLLALPFWAVDAVKGWSFFADFCKVTGAVFKINMYCGMFLLVSFSLERYLSIVHSLKALSRRRLRLGHACCVTVWICCILLSIPDWISLQPINNPGQENKQRCLPAMSYWFGSAVIFLVAAAFEAFCFFSIALKLHGDSPSQQRQRAACLILVLVLTFFISWMPYNIAIIVDTRRGRQRTMGKGSNQALCEDGQRTSLENGLIVTSALACLHCCLNPFIYMGFVEKFRNHMLGVLRCHKVKDVQTTVSLSDSCVVQPSTQQALENTSLNQMPRTVPDTADE